MLNSKQIKDIFYTKYKDEAVVRENILSILEGKISDYHYQVIYQESVEDDKEIFEVLVRQIGEIKTRQILGNVFTINPEAGDADIENFVDNKLEAEELIKFQTGGQNVREDSSVQK